MKKIIFTLFFIFIFTIPLSAKETATDKITDNISNELTDFKEALPNEVLDLLPNEIWNGDFSQLINSDFNEKTVLEMILNYVFFDIGNILKSFSGILIIIIISSIFNMLAKSFSSELIKSSFSLASSLCVSLTIFNVCTSLASMVCSYMKVLCGVMEAFSPLMAALYIMTGNITTGGIANASMVLFITVIEKFLLLFMLPIVNISICFSSIKCLGGIDFSGISKLLKTSFTGITVFIMSILMFVLSCKSTLSQANDSLSIKTAKFAISSFVPVVGSTLNDALRTITSSLTLIKNSCGILAIIVILVIILPAVISLLLYRLSFSILSSASKALGGTNDGLIIDEANSLCGFLLALIICTGILFIFALTILIKSTVVI